MNRLKGRPIIVTGGGSGIGRGACLRLAEEGAPVVVADRRGELAEAVAAEVQSAGGRALPVTCDVTDEHEVAAMVATTVRKYGGVYGLVANAGTAGSGWLHETELEDWQFVLNVNLTGVFLCAKHVIAAMLAADRGGAIVVTSSIAGSVVGAGGSAASYTASKHAVIGLTKQIAVDYGDRGIRANVIQPGPVEESNLGKHVREDRAGASTPPAELPRPKPWLPIRRAGRIAEYGAAIAFLLSDDAGYITGAALPVDGGYLTT